MGVVKTSKSGKQVQFIADNGEIYTISTILLGKMLNAQNSSKFIVLTRLPVGASPNRFPVSPVWNDMEVQHVEKANEDGLSPKTRKERKEETQFQDKTVW